MSDRRRGNFSSMVQDRHRGAHGSMGTFVSATTVGENLTSMIQLSFSLHSEA